MPAPKDTVRAWVGDHRGVLSAWTRAIWELAEPDRAPRPVSARC